MRQAQEPGYRPAARKEIGEKRGGLAAHLRQVGERDPLGRTAMLAAGEISAAGISPPLTTARTIGRITCSARARRPFTSARRTRAATVPRSRLPASAAPAALTSSRKPVVGRRAWGSARSLAVPEGHTDCLRDSTAVTRRTSSRGLNGLIT